MKDGEQILRPEIAGERLAKAKPECALNLGKPSREPHAAQSHRSAELNGGYKFAGGGEIALLARFLDAALCGLFGPSVSHGSRPETWLPSGESRSR